ncbi:hypothetical protein [Polaromonas sp.]|uniref:hypothetical protein n=1 Tax=Polaromonas sp. TaxID=1869339 RepID=UPI00352B68ED
MSRDVINRTEMIGATLELGGPTIELAEYATTGLLAVAVGPRGHGKTNAGLLIAEQLADQGWVSVLIDPEGELESMYGAAVKSPADLIKKLASRKIKILVVCATDAEDFVPYGQAILEAAEEHRKPIFVMVDEGQLFTSPRRRSDGIGDSADILNQFAERGRKRSLDLFVTAHRYSGTLHRSLFSNKNLTLVGCQEDPTAWAGLAPQFKASRIDYSDLNALGPGEFFCLNRRGVEKVRMPMAEALKKVAPKATAIKRTLPATFSEWDQAMRDMTDERLQALTPPVVELLSAVAGLSPQQVLAGGHALADELEARA